MSIKRDAIKLAYPSAISVLINEDATAKAWDIDGNEITLVDATINEKMSEAESSANMDRLRMERNNKLAETDYLALSDNTMSDDWQTYRQSLRNITNTYNNVDDVVWPTKPTE